MTRTAAEEKTDVGLDTIQFKVLTQVNRRALPKLTLGVNHVRLSADEQLETVVLWPPLHAGRYRDTVFSEEDVFCTDQPDGICKATLGSAVNGKECRATWRLKVPTAIEKVNLGVVATNRSSASYVSLRQSFDGEHYSEFFRKSNGDFPFDQQPVFYRWGDNLARAGIRMAVTRNTRYEGWASVFTASDIGS